MVIHPMGVSERQKCHPHCAAGGNFRGLTQCEGAMNEQALKSIE